VGVRGCPIAPAENGLVTDVRTAQAEDVLEFPPCDDRSLNWLAGLA